MIALCLGYKSKHIGHLLPVIIKIDKNISNIIVPFKSITTPLKSIINVKDLAPSAMHLYLK